MTEFNDRVLPKLAKFRTTEPWQTIIEIGQVIGIGVWILLDVWPDFKTIPNAHVAWFSIPNGGMLYLGLFFIIDAFLLFNARMQAVRPPGASSQGIDSSFIEQRKRELENSKRWLGENHPRTLTRQLALLKAYSRTGEHERSITYGIELYDTAIKKFGPTSPITIQAGDTASSAIVGSLKLNDQSECPAEYILFLQKVLSECAIHLPPSSIHTLRIEDCLAHALDSSYGNQELLETIGYQGNKEVHHGALESDRNEVIRAVVTLLLDCALILVAAPFRALRVARPIMILRRLSVATDKESNWRFPLISRETFLILQLGVLLVYSLGLTVLAIGDLIFVAEINHFGHLINSLPDAIWYSVQQITLVGSNQEVRSVSGKVYSVLLLFMGLGIIGLFGMLFQRIFGMAFLPRQVNHKELLEGQE